MILVEGEDPFYEPKDCYFSVHIDEYYECPAVVVWTKDDLTDSLGLYNLGGLPEYFGHEDAEGLWFIDEGNIDNIIRHMQMCGFTYQE